MKNNRRVCTDESTSPHDGHLSKSRVEVSHTRISLSGHPPQGIRLQRIICLLERGALKIAIFKSSSSITDHERQNVISKCQHQFNLEEMGNQAENTAACSQELRTQSPAPSKRLLVGTNDRKNPRSFHIYSTILQTQGTLEPHEIPSHPSSTSTQSFKQTGLSLQSIFYIRTCKS